MKLFSWSGRTSKKSFGDRIAPRLAAALPDATLERTDDLGFKVRWPDRTDTGVVSLDNAYQEFLAHPGDFEAIAERYVSNTAKAFAPNEPLDPARVLPFVKSRDWLMNAYTAEQISAPDGPWFDALNDELIVAYAEHRDGYNYLMREVFAESGIDEPNLRQRALRNLRERTPNIEWVGERVHLISVGGNYEATMILREDTFAAFTPSPTGRFLIGVPDRNTLAVAIETSPCSVRDLAHLTMSLYRSEPFSISPLLFEWLQGVVTPLDMAHEDDAHPIPKLDVIDVFATRKGGGATLSLVIASPLDASPRSIYRLYRKLDSYVCYTASDEHRSECGKPEPNTTRIEVHYHPDSAAAMIDLLANQGEWIESHGVGLTLRALEPDA